MTRSITYFFFEIVLKKVEVKRIENYFASKEISAFQLCENLKRIIANRNEKNIADNKRFRKTIKPVLSKKIIFLKEYQRRKQLFINNLSRSSKRTD